MRILTFSLDKKFLDKNSAVNQRALRYVETVESFSVLVPSIEKQRVVLSSKVFVESSGGKTKIRQFLNLFRLGKELIKQNKIDVISAQDPLFLGLLAIYLGNKFKIGVEIQVHGWEKMSFLRKYFSHYILPRANSIRTVSERLKQELIRDYGVKGDKITVVPILLEPKIENTPELNKNEKFTFLTVGRLVEIKNIKLQIKAAAELKNKGFNFVWLIIGDGAEKNNLQKLVTKLSVVDRVKFLGQKTATELAAYYKIADCFVLTSYAEGWGMAVVEAARAGVPIVMTDVGCAGELIKNNESGLIIANRLPDLMMAIEKIYSNKELREKLINGARRALDNLPNEEGVLSLYLASWQKAKL